MDLNKTEIEFLYEGYGNGISENQEYKIPLDNYSIIFVSYQFHRNWYKEQIAGNWMIK